MSRIERDGSTNTITIHPAEGKHSASIVICHGLGDSADGFADVAELLCKQFPYLKAILPSAKTQPEIPAPTMIKSKFCGKFFKPVNQSG